MIKYKIYFWFLFFSIVICTSRPQNLQRPEIISLQPSRAQTTPATKLVVVGSNFSPDAAVYFEALQARDLVFINSSTLQVSTPYLRPGRYKIYVKTQGVTVRSDAIFTVLGAPVDSDFDRAETLVKKDQNSAAIALLNEIAKRDSDHQVRAYAYFRLAQIYLAQGDYWRAAGSAAAIWDPEAGTSIQTAWYYRLLDEETAYALSISNDQGNDLRIADWAVEKDVTGNSEPIFFRALLNARYGNLVKAKTDLDSVLESDPNNPSYRALAAYISALAGNSTSAHLTPDEPIKEARALGLLGQAAYLNGDYQAAQSWWAKEARIDEISAKLAYWCGKKHLQYGQERVAKALLAESTHVSPESNEGKQAQALLSTLGETPH